MPIDLLTEDPGVVWLVARLAEEGKVCVIDSYQGAELYGATYAADKGLIVTDANGNRYRLMVKAEKLPKAKEKK